MTMPPSPHGSDALERGLDAVTRTAGRVMGWLMIPVVFIVFANAILRYGFGIGYAWFQELYIWINGVAVLLAAAYTWQDDAQVRVPIFYDRFTARTKAIVEIVGILFILLPAVAIFAYTSWAPVLRSWRVLERSRVLDGLPGVFVLRTFILVFCALMILQAVAFLIRHIRTLVRGPALKRPQ
jgi:TRAP-type mannitol/chloroaromatic compound transport system permease small subunit